MISQQVRELKKTYPGASRSELKQFLRGQLDEKLLLIYSKCTCFIKNDGNTIRRRYPAIIKQCMTSTDWSKIRFPGKHK